MRALNLLTSTVVCTTLLLGTAHAQKPTNSTLPIPSEGTALDVPGAKELPNPALMYKVLFTLTKNADKPDEQVNPMLESIATMVNTLAKYNVPASHRKFAVIIYHDATDIILTDEAYKARHSGHSNPNIALMQQLAKAGVAFKVCGYAVTRKKIDPKTIQPEVELDLVAWMTKLNLAAEGYTILPE